MEKKQNASIKINYDVIFLDITLFLSIADTPDLVVKEIQKDIIQELKSEFPEAIHDETESLLKALMQIHSATKRKFSSLLMSGMHCFEKQNRIQLFNENIYSCCAAIQKQCDASDHRRCYMTGILPIKKKYGTQSALTDFREYTMLEPGPLAPFVGFTQVEVKRLCEEYPLDFDQAQKWYDGYIFEQAGHIYSPNSIIRSHSNKSLQIIGRRQKLMSRL